MKKSKKTITTKKKNVPKKIAPARKKTSVSKIKKIEVVKVVLAPKKKESIKEDKTDEEINLEFKHYVKNILSIIETLISGDTYKALRRLLQNEIYSCATVYISDRNKAAKG